MKNDKINTDNIQHTIANKSKAIYRQAVQKPISQIKPLVRKIGHNMDIARSKSITHFAPRTATVSAPKPNLAKKHFDIRPTKHPLAKITHTPKPIIDTSAKAIKETAITEAFAKIDEAKVEAKKKLHRNNKIFKIVIISITLILIVGYFIFINLPNISISVANAQAGIKASYPEYCPDGYSSNGSVSFSEGQVTIDFHSNSSDKKFSIKQIKSSWDSSAVKNQVNTDSKGEFITTEEGGLTIYSYNGNAAWVNGGILYKISDDSSLNNDQIRRIATSL